MQQTGYCNLLTAMGIAKKTMRGAQPAATAPAVTTDEVLPVIPMSVGHRLQAQDAIVLRVHQLQGLQRVIRGGGHPAAARGGQRFSNRSYFAGQRRGDQSLRPRGEFSFGGCQVSRLA